MATVTASPAEPQQQKISHAKDLALLFSVPLAVALISAAFVFIPRLLAHPAYSFIYSYCDNYGCDGTNYSLRGDHLVKTTPPVDQGVFGTSPQLAVYDSATDSTHTLTYDEARTYSYINSSKSPDGYTLIHVSGNNTYFFGGDYQDLWQLQSGIKKKTLHLSGTSDTYGIGDLKFIGWIQK